MCNNRYARSRLGRSSGGGIGGRNQSPELLRDPADVVLRIGQEWTSGGRVMHRVGYSLLLIVLFTGLGGSAAQAQLRFESEYLLWNRNNDSDSTTISGAVVSSAADADFGYSSGYQFTLGGSLSYFDVEASFMQIPSWKD